MENKSNNKIIIEVKNLTKSFNETMVLNNINFKLFEGESLAVIGASGSGKSVLLKNIIGLLSPDKGSIKINNVEMVGLKRSVKEKILLDLGLTFRHGALYDSLQNCENIVFKVKNKEKLTDKDAKELALSIIIRLGLNSEILDHARMNKPGQGFYKVLAESALRAVRLCQPLRVPATGYERWKDLQLNFDAREMLRG